jgi:transposase
MIGTRYDINEPIAGYPNIKAMLEDLYVREGLSIPKVAARMDVSNPTVFAWLKRCGIPSRNRGGAFNPGTNQWKIHRLDPRYVWTQSNNNIAVILGISYSLVYKFKREAAMTWNTVSSVLQQDLNGTQS